jgi:hypothetical protein
MVMEFLHKEIRPEKEVRFLKVLIHKALLMGKNKALQSWWCPTVIPAVGRMRHGDQELKDSLHGIGKPCLNKAIRAEWAAQVGKHLLSRMKP